LAERLHYRLSKLTDKHGLFSAWATRRFLRKVKAIKPDIVHLHNIHGYYINYEILFNYLRKANIPVVWSLHDCWSMTGHCTHFVEVDCEKWKIQCYDCPLTGAYPYAKRDNSRQNYRLKRKMFTSLGERLNLVSSSQWLKSIIERSFFAECGAHQHIINNGIDITTFSPCEAAKRSGYNLEGKKVIIAVASAWSERKGLGDMYKLSTMLPEDYRVVMVGLSQTQIDTAPSSVIALPRTNSATELAQWYSLADVFVNLTYEDTYPTTNLEAISCGTPVITYRTGGSPESVTPRTGRVVEQGNLEGVVKAIEELCAEDREAMRKRCREYAIEHFDRDKKYDMYLDLYEKLLTNK
jgi:glycosyltransferase involved in cell wall biosynthesis